MPHSFVTSAGEIALKSMIESGLVKDAADINCGYCDLFAKRLIREFVIANPDEAFEPLLRDNGEYYIDPDEEGGPFSVEHLLSELPSMKPPEGMTWDELNAIIAGMKLSPDFHSFVVYEDRVYDSEALQGVDGIFDLPVFCRILSDYKASLEQGSSGPGSILGPGWSCSD